MRFFLDQLPLDVEVPSTLEFFRGSNECLSQLSDDPSLGCKWYQEGYSVISYEHLLRHQDLLSSLNEIVRDKLEALFPLKRFSGFSLDKYHEYVNEEEHRMVADPILKRLYVQDMPVISTIFVSLISQELDTSMCFRRGLEHLEHWIILRINPPYSLAYNPPHKDIYEYFDANGSCPQMINAWVPIVGVNSFAGLGLSVGSHLFSESLIVRTKAGAQMNDRKFSVNLIKSWNGSNKLSNVFPEPGSFLCFSSHLVHGLGINRNLDLTRVALEFRLHKKL